MPFIVNVDVMLARRKKGLNMLAELVGCGCCSQCCLRWLPGHERLPSFQDRIAPPDIVA